MINKNLIMLNLLNFPPYIVKSINLNLEFLDKFHYVFNIPHNQLGNLNLFIFFMTKIKIFKQ